jgi:hypothetical protein
VLRKEPYTAVHREGLTVLLCVGFDLSIGLENVEAFERALRDVHDVTVWIWTFETVHGFLFFSGVEAEFEFRRYHIGFVLGTGGILGVGKRHTDSLRQNKS